MMKTISISSAAVKPIRIGGGLGAYTKSIELSSVTQHSNKKVYVVLFGGQSNAAGWGYHQYLLDENHLLSVAQNDVEMYTGCGIPSLLNQIVPLQSGAGQTFFKNGTQQYPAITDTPVNRFGPELSLARVVRDGIDIPDSQVVIIKYAIGGTALYNDWIGDGTADNSSDGSIYRAFQSTVNAGLAAIQAKYPYHEIEVIGMGWVQGEADASEGMAGEYEANLTTFIADVRATYNTNMIFALSRLSLNQADDVDWATIRAAQDAIASADPRVVATSTDGTNYPVAIGYAEGQVHYLSSALLQIGEDLGTAINAMAALDSDNDRLPDEWENGFIPPGAAGLGNMPDDDYDGDGLSDRDEFRAGTCPVDATDGLLLSITNAAAIHWSAKRGIDYDVQHSIDLLSWATIDTVLMESNGAVSVSILSVATNPFGFFRLGISEE
jgi:hypothetical protein